MAEGLGKFLSFVGAIFKYFWESFFKDTAPFFSKAAEGPIANPFETIIALFFIVAAIALAVGIVWSLLRLSPRPFMRLSEKFTRWMAFIGAWIITILIVSMVYEVIARYFFDAPTKWAFEMAYMLMGTSFMLGIGLCMQMRRHIRVDFVYDHVSGKWKAVIDLIGYIFLIPMLLWLTAGLWEYFHAAYKVDETSGESAWNPIIWPFKFSFVMGFVLLLMQTVVEVIRCVLTLTNREVPQPPPIEGLQ